MAIAGGAAIGGMNMSRPETLGVVVAMLLLIGAGFAAAQVEQAVPCDNGEAPSVIPTGDNGEPATAKQIGDDFRPTIGQDDIRRCLNADDPHLVNHLIDYEDYVRALKNSGIAEDRRLVISDSVLWSSRPELDLSHLGEGEMSAISSS